MLSTWNLSAFTGNLAVTFYSTNLQPSSQASKTSVTQMPPRYVPPHRRDISIPQPTASVDPPLGPNKLKLGDELEGQVSSVASYGAFVDLGENRTGLVHISELANAFVKNVTDHVSIGDTVRVRVLGITHGGQRISLSMKQSDAVRATGYDRIVELGGDWGHPWNDDGSAQYVDLGPRPMGRHAWEPDLDLFEPWVDPDKGNE